MKRYTTAKMSLSLKTVSRKRNIPRRGKKLSFLRAGSGVMKKSMTSGIGINIKGRPNL